MPSIVVNKLCPLGRQCFSFQACNPYSTYNLSHGWMDILTSYSTSKTNASSGGCKTRRCHQTPCRHSSPLNEITVEPPSRLNLMWIVYLKALHRGRRCKRPHTELGCTTFLAAYFTVDVMQILHLINCLSGPCVWHGLLLLLFVVLGLARSQPNLRCILC